jgi:hypothetical protein
MYVNFHLALQQELALTCSKYNHTAMWIFSNITGFVRGRVFASIRSETCPASIEEKCALQC